MIGLLIIAGSNVTGVMLSQTYLAYRPTSRLNIEMHVCQKAEYESSNWSTLNLGCHVDVCMYVPLLIHECIIELLSAAVSKNVKSWARSINQRV